MADLKVNSISNANNNGAPDFPNGFTAAGITDGSSVAAGNVGEIIEVTQISVGVDATPTDYGTLNLTAGIWQLNGLAMCIGPAGGGADLRFSWNEVSATHANYNGSDHPYYSFLHNDAYDTSNGAGGITLPTLTLNLTSAKPIYAVLSRDSGAATTTTGYIRAVRIA
jgi:hypothetical protein